MKTQAFKFTFKHTQRQSDEAIQIINTIVKTIRSELSHHITDIAQKDTNRQEFAQTLWSQYTEYMVIHKFHSKYFSRLLQILDDYKSKVFKMMLVIGLVRHTV